MNYEILSIETARKLETLKKENQELKEKINQIINILKGEKK